MFKVRLAILGALALFIVSGISASAASASGPFWHVGGTSLNGTRQIKLQSKGPLFLKVPGTLEIRCENSISEGGTIEGNTTTQGQGKGRTLYSSCKVLVPGEEKCLVGDTLTNRGQIKTSPIKSYLAKAGQTGIVEVFEPGQGNIFTQFNLVTGKSACAFKEVGAIGSAVAEVIPARVEGQEGLISFPEKAILKVIHEETEVTLPSLKTVGAVGTFSGVYAARLATFPENFGAFET
ncbi:MAG TPA: hypothetical protein VIC06_02840 [Solirubrobacteraceae bacterium]|jgi:hypothetical protein